MSRHDENPLRRAWAPLLVILAVLFLTPRLGPSERSEPAGQVVLQSVPAPSDPAGAPAATAVPEPAAATTPLPAGVPEGAQPATVARVVDGDTIWVEVTEPAGALSPAAAHKIRLLEIDSPETVAPGRPVQCWGPEAAQFASQQLPVGSTVYLVADQEDTDQYGRFLRYVWTADGVFLNALAVAQGHARAILYEPNDAHMAQMRTTEAAAKAAGLGMWGPPCDYDAPAPPPGAPPPPPPAPAPAAPAPVAPAPLPPPAQPLPPEQAPPPLPPPESAPLPPPPPAPLAGDAVGGCDPNYSGCVPIASDVDCAGGSGNGPAYVAGPVQVIGTDIYGLDGNDNDGIGCEG